ncbi:methionyl-tRNA formyltransferase [Candidatus Dojkabacteria bacterium]|jgi:methionyl-tRNA formyltransferase|uniref:Methionyl-tRNA formyltransferase n=1 Tax=Candidatus Dojkabacteria bacterium TaxID=2099670 RepID=A0A955I7M5_9BACT|nr:methionyl-tRNA formyltransferase [Candidatus Dojkabacteria bacterium]
MNKIRTMFFGSGEFAVPILEGLLSMESVNLVAVVTQMDKPAGRNQDLKPVPVKEILNKKYPDLKVYTPVKYRVEQEAILENEKPEIIVVADYGQILPELTINYPKFKCLNVHGSILPDLRGAVPIPIAILKGYKKTGVSIPIMTVGLDDGPVLAMTEVEIDDTDTTESLKIKLAKAGAELLERTLPQWINGKLVPLEQNEKKATIADKTLIEKSKAQITKDTTAETADRMVRAFYPWPVAWCEIEMNGKAQRLKIFKAKISENITNSDIGKIYRDGKRLILNLNNGSIELLNLQLEGKKRAGNNDYLYLSEAKLIS